MNKLFTDMLRTDDGPMSHGESSYSYLNNSNRIEAARIRQVLEDWYCMYKDKNKNLLRRFQSLDEIPHVSAAFELYLHKLFSRLGYSIIIHPETTSRKMTKPDFLLQKDSLSPFYVEAVIASDSSSNNRATERRMNVLYEQIEKIKNRDFFLMLSVRGRPDSQPSGAKLRKELENWLGSLNPDSIPRDNPDAWPKNKWNHEGWEIEFTALPRSVEKRGRKDIRIIGSFMPEVRRKNTWKSIRDSVVAKRNNFGEIDRGLVVAVNVDSSHLDSIEEMEALFGQEQFLFSVGASQDEPEFQRARNGIWNGPEGPRCTRVSAVMFFQNLHPWTFGVKGANLYLNPWAQFPIDGPLLELDHVVVDNNGRLKQINGKKPYEVLGLQKEWPMVE